MERQFSAFKLFLVFAQKRVLTRSEAVLINYTFVAKIDYVISSRIHRWIRWTDTAQGRLAQNDDGEAFCWICGALWLDRCNRNAQIERNVKWQTHLVLIQEPGWASSPRLPRRVSAFRVVSLVLFNTISGDRLYHLSLRNGFKYIFSIALWTRWWRRRTWFST